MKILHVYKSYYPHTMGGVEQCIRSLCQALPDMTHEILTTAPHATDKKALFDQHLIHYFPTTMSIASCPFSWSLLKKFRAIAQEADVIHYHFPWPFADLLSLLAPTQKPTVVTYHSDIVQQRYLKCLYSPVMHHFLKTADVIVATSEPYRRSSPVLARYPQKVRTISIGMDSTLYPFPSESVLNQWKTRLGTDFFLFIGTLRYYKGLHFLLEALVDTPFRVVIVGTGPEEDKLHAQAKRLGLKNLVWTGRVTEEDKVAIIQLSKALVMPSHLRSEAFCISLLEGLLFGKPLISTELGTGTSWVNQHQVTGLVVPPSNPKALREAMEQFMTNLTLYERLQQNIQHHYQTHFTGTAMGNQYRNLYQELLSLSNRTT